MKWNWILYKLLYCYNLSEQLLVLIVIHHDHAIIRWAWNQIIALTDYASDLGSIVKLSSSDYVLGLDVEVFDHAVRSTDRHNASILNLYYGCDFLIIFVEEDCFLLLQAQKTDDVLCNVKEGYIVLLSFSESQHKCYREIILKVAQRFVIKRLPDPHKFIWRTR